MQDLNLGCRPSIPLAITLSYEKSRVAGYDFPQLIIFLPKKILPSAVFFNEKSDVVNCGSV